MYDIHAYGRMIADRPRMQAYAEALRRVVTPGAIVVDLGTGTGIFALIACRHGARRVFAIEPSDAIQVAREIAAANGYADRIEFIQDRSTQVTLPEPADVIVSDLRGVLPLFNGHLTAIADARRRLLAPGGTMIPMWDTLRVAVVETPDVYRTISQPWDGNEYGFDMRAARPYVMNAWRKARAASHRLLVDPRTWATLDYRTLDQPNTAGEARWTMEREGTAHGICVWFDTELVDGVGFSNAPGEHELVYGTPFLPWLAPVPLAVGDVITVSMAANLVGEEYVWRWTAAVHAAGDPARVKATFEQSSFAGQLLVPSRLRRRAEDHVPHLNEDGLIDRLVLALMGDDLPLADVAARILGRFPSRFPTSRDALERVRQLSDRYSL